MQVLKNWDNPEHVKLYRIRKGSTYHTLTLSYALAEIAFLKGYRVDVVDYYLDREESNEYT